jgi:multiple sugar transport system substrate-binding protein
MWLDTYKKDKAVPDTCVTDGFDQLAANLQNGTTAMTVAHIKLSSIVYEELGDKMGVMPLPVGKNGKNINIVGDWEVGMNAKSEKKDAAFKFMSWLCSADQIKIWDSTLKSVPVCKSLENDPTFADNPAMVASMKALDNAGIIQPSDSITEWTETTWPEIVQKALTDADYQSEDMMKDLKEALEKQ